MIAWFRTHSLRCLTISDDPFFPCCCWLVDSAEARKMASFVRARNSGVNRLLRSGGSNSNTSSYQNSVDRGVSSNAQSSGAKLNGSAAAPNPSQPDAMSNGQPSALNDHDLENDEDDDAWYLNQPKWTHVVLKMTSFTESDLITSFRFDTQGGGIGREASNVASVPADKLLARVDHAKIRYNQGQFYLENGENASGTFIRLSPCCGDDVDRMQWPLDDEVSFRVGKSDFMVTHYDEARQQLQIAALSGKLSGTQFTIGKEGAGIGRSAENAIHAGDGELSRKHAAIWFDELTNQFYLIDLDSTNGTFMKLVGPYSEPYRLEIGDDLLISQTCFTVNRLDFGAHANMGARKYMEDAHTIIQDLNIEPLSRLKDGMYHPQSYFAVYDGHGGMEASSFLGDALHLNIIDEFHQQMKKFDSSLMLSTQEINARIQQCLLTAFEKTDEEFLRESDHPAAGSTATTVFIAGNYMFVANVGDSRTVLSRKCQAVRLSNDHKPSRTDEAQRIRDIGGFVIHGRIMGELAVSRAFGDQPFKSFDIPEPAPKSTDTNKSRNEYDSQELPVNPNDILKGPLVIATPEITVTELSGM